MAIGRFAPSPTSDLHVGNLRTALAAWLLARVESDAFCMRIEDLDQARVAAASGVAQRQLDDLASLGIDWDGEVLVQSERTEHYASAVAALGERVYPCFCTRKEIAEAASAPHDGFRAYPGTCARLSSSQRSQRALLRAPALRVRAESVTWEIEDLHAGRVSSIVDDFVLQRGDGTFAYNLAVVVDDAAQGVELITRGDDLLSSAPRQAWLAQQLGLPQPKYAHVSLVLNESGQRIAKRDGAVTLAGQNPAEVCAYLCETLGLPPASTASEALADLPAGFRGNPTWWSPVTFRPRK